MNKELEDYARHLTRVVRADTMLFPDRPTGSLLVILVARKLDSGGGMNASSLADATHIPRSSVLRRLSYLVRQSYVIRQEDGLYHATDFAISTIQIHY
ncbi:MAG: helix-turn-helix domain-containing protein, partial [Rhodospirillales bacterium]|nr:helix-turn-helix domain-containing protein [Rhodospirillales bacterium]